MALGTVPLLASISVSVNATLNEQFKFDVNYDNEG